MNDIDLYIDATLHLNANENFVINKFWKPNQSVIKIIEQICINNNYVKNLEIGPGFVPFSFATHFIGCNEKIKNYIDIDIDYQSFPYKDDEFDFIYCRHVLEDIQNPDFALREIFRVSKCGYIETPSPLIEITKNVDAGMFANSYCGYIHHRYIVWSNIEKNEIYFLPKYSCILEHILNINDESKPFQYNLINNFQVYWNNYFVFNINNGIPKIIMYKNGVNFGLNHNGMIEDYILLVSRAINESIQNTNYFVNHYKHLLK